MKFLVVLSEIGQSLADAHGLQDGLKKTLEILRQHKLFARGYLILQNPRTGRISVSVAEGLSAIEFRRLENRLEKDFIKSFFERGEPQFVKKTSDDVFFDFVGAREYATSFAGAPIILNEKTHGLLGVEFSPIDRTELEIFKDFLAVVAAMISQAVKVRSEMAGEKEKLIEETSHLQKELREKYDFGNLIGNSGSMREIYAQIAQIARTNATVLLRGESGTGKEMIANALHYNSLRSKKPFIKVNCAALPDTLIESELFGYEKGAFSGANQRGKGRFELADGGTLFLDEIGDLPAPTQIKLLRVLQEREFERLGGTETIKVNVRLVAATNKNLEKEMANGAFREDLFYRFNVFTIFLPPLRERKSDILLLAEHFLEKYEKIHEKRIRRISTPAIDMLTAYHFPGNVRELENAIELAVLACDENVIHGHHLPPTLQTAEVSGTVTKLTLDSAVAAFERDLIQDALKTTGGNCSRAAVLLNTTERIINYKISKYEINPRRFRNK